MFIITLADAYGCKILPVAKTALGTPRFTGGTLQKLYSCVPANSSSQYEVHVLSVYKVANRRSSITAKAKVNIVSRGKSNRPIVLVLVSYRATNWFLNIPSNVTINKVILVSLRTYPCFVSPQNFVRCYCVTVRLL